MSDTESGEACIGCNEPGRLEVSPQRLQPTPPTSGPTPLAMLICPRCEEESPDRFRFCGYCGSPLTVGAITEERRTVTVLFADLRRFASSGDTLIVHHRDSPQ